MAAQPFAGRVTNAIREIFSSRETDNFDYLPKLDFAKLLFAYYEKKPFTDRHLEDSYKEMDSDANGKVSNIGNHSSPLFESR